MGAIHPSHDQDVCAVGGWVEGRWYSLNVHTDEIKYLEATRDHLNSIQSGWILGDNVDEYRNVKSADLVNTTHKIAIEVKDDFSEIPPILSSENPEFERTRDLSVLSNRYKHDIEDAHRKFKNYPEFETAVLIRFGDFTFSSIHYLLGGLVRLTQFGRIPNTDKNISRNCANCSIFVFHNIRYDELEYYRNPLSNRPQEKIIETIKSLDVQSIKEITQKDFIS